MRIEVFPDLPDWEGLQVQAEEQLKAMGARFEREIGKQEDQLLKDSIMYCGTDKETLIHIIFIAGNEIYLGMKVTMAFPVDQLKFAEMIGMLKSLENN